MLTVGEILRNEREKKGLKLSEVESKLKVREKFLKEIENDRWETFASKIYIEGVIKNYARLLGLDQHKMIAFFRREYEKKEEVTFKRRLSARYLTPETRRYLYVAVLLVFFTFVFYFGYQLKVFLSKPKVEIISPKQESFKKENSIRIVGRTQKEAVVNIFGNRIYQNKDGIFTYDYPLKPGKNELVIEVIGANGKKTVLRKDFFLIL